MMNHFSILAADASKFKVMTQFMQGYIWEAKKIVSNNKSSSPMLVLLIWVINVQLLQKQLDPIFPETIGHAMTKNKE